jgi:phenylpropionate dioxygenase-like ring-hydroxylating dioxygenase large terminal subunit
VKESGRCATGSFECPWHGFSYDLEGRVVHVPLRETFDEKQLKGLRIPLVHVREWAAFVWISLSAEPPPFEAFLGELKPELDAYALSTGEARYRNEWRIGANWKTVVDASLEVLHVPITHKDTVKEGSLLWRDAALKIFQPHSMMVIPMRKQYEDSAPVEETHRKTMLCQYLAFPSTIFSCRPDRVQTFTAWPAGPRDTVLQAWGFAPPPPEGEDAETWRAKNDVDWSHFCALVEDDVNVLAEAGRVYDTLGYKRNLFAAAEGRLTAFHEAVNELAATSA